MQDLSVKNRSAPLAAWMNCLAPGLGLFYLGQPQRALLCLLLVTAPWFVWLLLPWRGEPRLLLAVAGISILLLIAIMLTCWRQAPRLSPMILLPGQRWYGYAGFWLFFILLLIVWLSLMLWSLGLMPHQVAGNSMARTIGKNEWVLIDLNKHSPDSLRRGDIVLFSDPEQARDSLLRVVGLPGERITVHGGGLFVDGRWQPEPYVDDMLNRRKIPEGVVEANVPGGQVFVLADNRDNARDSRYWGALDAERVRGRMVKRLSGRWTDWLEMIPPAIGLSLSRSDN